MQRKRYYYLINLQYLGFRYHGWQKQPDVNTAQRMVERTLAYILDRKNFKTLAAGRTDAMVSVENTYIELFLDETPIENLDDFLILFNKNLPQDIRALGIEETDAKFNIIQHPKTKEYRYLFAFGSKHHPFAAPYMTNILEDLDIELMQQGAKCFEGSHYFKAYTFRPTPTMQFNGTIDTCEIIENTEFTASFFPEKSYCLRICRKHVGRQF